MNDKMLDIVGLADEEFLREAEGKPMMKQSKCRRRISAKIVAIAAAAAVMTVTAGAVAVARLSHKESVDYYYNEKMASDIEQKGYAVGQVTQNEHIKMTLENLLVDENYAYGVVTVEALDEIGKDAFRQEPLSYLLDKNGTYIENEYFSSMIGILMTGTNNTNPEKQAHMIQICLRDPYAEKKTDVPEKAKVVFSKASDNYDPRKIETVSDVPKDELEGLCFELDLKPNVQTLKLEAASGHKAVISGFMFDIQYSCKNVKSFDYKNVPNRLKINYTDGKSRTLKSDFNSRQCDFSPECGSLGDEECEYRFKFNEVLDVSKIESVEIAGETYKVK